MLVIGGYRTGAVLAVDRRSGRAVWDRLRSYCATETNALCRASVPCQLEPRFSRERLQAESRAIWRPILFASVAGEALLGAVVILAAALLASHAPATHVSPIWPFSWRPSLAALDAPGGRQQLLIDLLPVVLAAAIMLVSLVRRAGLWVSLSVLIVAMTLSGLRLGSLLSIDAYPTTFAASPTEFADSSIAHGALLFATHCAICHGREAQGDGPAAKSLPVAPADLTAAHFWSSHRRRSVLVHLARHDTRRPAL